MDSQEWLSLHAGVSQAVETSILAKEIHMDVLEL